jgi:hypothetical protein
MGNNMLWYFYSLQTAIEIDLEAQGLSPQTIAEENNQ